MKRFISMVLCLIMALSVFNVVPFTADAVETEIAETSETTSGTTGDCTWELNRGILTISGNGKMDNYYSYYRPWDMRADKVFIEAGVTSIGNYAFYSFSKVGGVEDVSIPNTVTSIGDYAFYNSNLKSVYIPNSVMTIGDYAFEKSEKLWTVSIGSSVKNIGNNAFSGCGIGEVSIYISDIESYCADPKIPIYMKNLSDTANYYLKKENGQKITNLIIPNTIETICNYAFYNCRELTTMTIPDSVTSIKYSAFSGCTGLTSVTIGNSVTSIGDYAFRGCTGLTRVNIPDSVKSIGSDAFSGCLNPTIYGVKGSYAQTYAKKNWIKFIEVPVCSECGKILYETNDIVVDAQKTVTCTEDGLTEGSHCAYCGEPLVAQKIIPHSHDKIEDLRIDATCTEDGEFYWHCGRCGELGEDVLPALGHDYKTVVTPETCTRDGYTTYTCSRCGDTYIADKIKAPGHDYSVVVNPPSCTEVGYTVHTCTRCKDTYVTDRVNALGHNYTVIIRKQPTSSQQGLMYVSCDRCDTKLNLYLPVLSKEDYTITKSSEPGKANYTLKDKTYGVVKIVADAPSEIELPTEPPTEINTEPSTDNNEEDVRIVADGKEYNVKKGQIINYVYYLNTDEKVCSIDAETLFDTGGLELLSITKVLGSVFPVLKDAVVLNDSVPGRLKYWYSSAQGADFSSDDSKLIVLQFQVTSDKGVYNIETKLNRVDGDGTNGYYVIDYIDDNGYVHTKYKSDIINLLKRHEGLLLVLGDSDGDGSVTILDATAIQRKLASLQTISFDEKTADADGDGELTILDATAIQRHLASLPTNENIGKPIA